MNGTEHTRKFLFFHGPRIIDLDTYLPTAMELKRTVPGADIHFIIFSQPLIHTLESNPTLIRAVRKSGSYGMFGGHSGGSLPKRLFGRAAAFCRIARLILRDPRPVLIGTRPFAEFPYWLFYILARLRGGSTVVLAKTRSPDRVHDIVWENRDRPEYDGKSIAAMIFGRDADLSVDYHDDQSDNFNLALAMGTAKGLPHARIGMPHLFPAWRDHVAAETENALAQLAKDGITRDTELYSFFAAKAGSAVNLRNAESIEFSARRTLDTLFELRPEAKVLFRPHPAAIHTAYVRDILKRYAGRLFQTKLHPEVLLDVSRRSLFNNPTNIIFSCFPGCMIDVADYDDDHYGKRGRVSLAHGLGPVHICPRDDDFSDHLNAVLTTDEPFRDPDLVRDRDAILQNNPSHIGPMLKLLDIPAGPAPARQSGSEYAAS
jgi:hypothetical protein